jgi:hypothetical protein
MNHDQLTRLARLREIDKRSATLELARRLAAEASIRDEVQIAGQGLQSEAAAGCDGFAQWLPRGLADRARAQARAAAAANATAVARALLARALVGGEIVNAAIAAHRRAQAEDAARLAQQAMDELAQRPREPG